MTARSLLAAVVLVLAVSQVAPAEPCTVTLSPLPEPGPPPGCFATLRIVNNSSQTVGGVMVRMQAGGPRYLWPISVAPGQTARLTVDLPARDGTQTYDVRLLEGPNPDAPPVASLRANVDWGRIERDDLPIDPAVYAANSASLPSWPQSARRAAIALAGALILASAAVLLVRRRGLRVGLVVAAAVCGLAGAWATVMDSDAQAVWEVPAPPDVGGTYVIVTASRTSQWHSHGALTPIYPEPSYLIADKAVVRGGTDFSVAMTPEDMRIFHRGGNDVPPEN